MSDEFRDLFEQSDPTATPALNAARGKVFGLLAELSGAIAELEGTARAAPPPTAEQLEDLLQNLAAPARPEVDATAADLGGPRIVPIRFDLDEWRNLIRSLGAARRTLRHVRRRGAADVLLDQLHELIGSAWAVLGAAEGRRTRAGGIAADEGLDPAE